MQDSLLPFPSISSEICAKGYINGYTMIPAWLLIWIMVLLTLLIVFIIWKYNTSKD